MAKFHGDLHRLEYFSDELKAVVTPMADTFEHDKLNEKCECNPMVEHMSNGWTLISHNTVNAPNKSLIDELQNFLDSIGITTEDNTFTHTFTPMSMGNKPRRSIWDSRRSRFQMVLGTPRPIIVYLN